MRELRRRQAEATGSSRRRPGTPGEPDGPSDDAEGDDAEIDADAPRIRVVGTDENASDDAADDAADGEPPDDRPSPIRRVRSGPAWRAGRGGGGGGGRRSGGGAQDGARSIR